MAELSDSITGKIFETASPAEKQGLDPTLRDCWYRSCVCMKHAVKFYLSGGDEAKNRPGRRTTFHTHRNILQ